MAWPILAGVLTVAAFVFFATTNPHVWERGTRTTAAVVTVASFGTFVGLYVLLVWVWALTSTWG